MGRSRAKKPKDGWRFLWWLACLPAAGALLAAGRGSASFAEWYALHIYPVLAAPVHGLSRLMPFSLMELVCSTLLLAAPAGVFFAVRAVVKAARAGGRRLALQRLGRLAAKLACAASGLLLAFVGLAGVNYYRQGVAAVTGWQIQPSTTAELQMLCSDLVAQANALAAVQPAHDAAGITDTVPQGWQAAGRTVAQAYDLLARRFPAFGGSYGVPKGMWGSWFMSRLQLTGVFFPFTVEANVNIEAPSFNIPYTMAHELAHLRGFMREDEANFIAWLVCGASPDVGVQYSGTLLALIHAGNALARADWEAYAALRQSYSPQVLADLADNNAYWAQFKDEPLSNLSEKANDAYLRANGQTDGTRSYGRMVDLLLAQWRAKQVEQG